MLFISMRCSRTLIAWLVVWSLQLVPSVTYAQDVGPGREVRAIRHDLPILLTPELTRLRAETKSSTPLNIDDVLIVDDHALVQWKASGINEIAIMAKRLGVWWLLHEIFIVSPGGIASYCDDLVCPGNPSGPTTGFIRQVRDVPPDLAAAAAALPLVAAADKRPPVGCANGYCTSADGDGYCVPPLAFSHAAHGECLFGPYGISANLAANDAASDTFVSPLIERAPTEGESWLARGGNAYFYLSGTLAGSSTVHVSSGTTLDVWFPFVLDTGKTYSLTIAHVTPIIGPTNGTLSNNTLHFVLPAFAIAPGADIMAEIDGDPLDNP